VIDSNTLEHDVIENRFALFGIMLRAQTMARVPGKENAANDRAFWLISRHFGGFSRGGAGNGRWRGTFTPKRGRPIGTAIPNTIRDENRKRGTASMKKSLLMSAAALVIAGPAFAQGTQSPSGGTQMPERAPAPQQSAPAEKMAPHDGQVPPGQSRSRDEFPGTTGQGTTGQATTGQGERSSGSGMPAASSRSPTTGQGAAGTSSNLTADQQTKITASLKQQQAPRATNVNFSIEIGTAIPATVSRAPLPRTVIEVYPAWRGYEYVMVEDEILIIDPATSRIVAIIEA
jgi:uncharacterized protein DUF1236